MFTTSVTDTGDVADENAAPTYDSFLDDPFNMAMYVVLPVMVFIYGGCCFIYCMAKLHRYCRRKARQRAKRLIHKDVHDDSDEDNDNNSRAKGARTNPVFTRQESTVAVVDLTEPEPVTARNVKPVVPPKPVLSRSPMPSAVAAPSRAAPDAVAPGYARPRDLQQHMQHLDDQLKAAFKLITDEPKKVRSRPDVCARNDENKKPVKRRGDSKMHFFVSDQ